MSPKYKLTYFNVTALGEGARYLFHYGNIPFEDVRIERVDWPKLKPSTPFGVLPMLEYKGKKVCQSIAICRYLGRIIDGLNGKTSWDALEADMIADTINDFKMKHLAMFTEQDVEKKAAMLETLQTETNPFFLGKFDDLVKKNGGHFINGQLTWVDFYFTGISELFNFSTGEDVIGKYENLKELVRKIESLPKVKEYISSRPKTDF